MLETTHMLGNVGQFPKRSRSDKDVVLPTMVTD